VVEDDDQLAAVISHEVAHALAHHASERIAEQYMRQGALRAADGSLDSLNREDRRHLIGLLSAGTGLSTLAHSRFQESEADHIGVFLMTFAGYDPEQSIAFWDRMRRLSSRGHQPPEILSTHPRDERRMAQLRGWVPQARGAKRAYDEGRIAHRALKGRGGRRLAADRQMTLQLRPGAKPAGVKR
jgi:predicted Zn-dependent protease